MTVVAVRYSDFSEEGIGKRLKCYFNTKQTKSSW